LTGASCRIAMQPGRGMALASDPVICQAPQAGCPHKGAKTMRMTRRDLAAAGALALGAASLIEPAAAADESAAVTQSVEALRKAIFGQDKAKLAALTAEQLSYGHSSAVVQDKAEFIK